MEHILRLSCGESFVELKVSPDEVTQLDKQHEWIERNKFIFGALFTLLRWEEGPVTMMRRLLADNPAAPAEERAGVERMIAVALAHRAEHGDPFEGRDD